MWATFLWPYQECEEKDTRVMILAFTLEGSQRSPGPISSCYRQYEQRSFCDFPKKVAGPGLELKLPFCPALFSDVTFQHSQHNHRQLEPFSHEI